MRQIFHEYAENKLSTRDIADMLTEEKAPKRWGAKQWESSRIVPHRCYKANRKRPEFPHVTDGLQIGEYKDNLVIRIGAEFATIDGRKIRMHIDQLPKVDEDRRRKEDEAEWKRIQADPAEWKQSDDQ